MDHPSLAGPGLRDRLVRTADHDAHGDAGTAQGTRHAGQAASDNAPAAGCHCSQWRPLLTVPALGQRHALVVTEGNADRDAVVRRRAGHGLEHAMDRALRIGYGAGRLPGLAVPHLGERAVTKGPDADAEA